MTDIHVPALVIGFLVLVLSLTVHEAAHAWTASRLGDDTARRLGRVSLNPIVHIDPIGTLLLPLVAMASATSVSGCARLAAALSGSASPALVVVQFSASSTVFANR